MFDPRKMAFTNTATILLPRNELSCVPFDIILMSNVYVWFYALAARMGILRTLRSDVYPTNLAFLPWHENLASHAIDIEAMRKTLVAACSSRLAAKESLIESLDSLRFGSFKQRLRDDQDSRINWGENFTDPKYEVSLGDIAVSHSDDGWRVKLSNDLFDYVKCNHEALARGLKVAIEQSGKSHLNRSSILNLSIPVGDGELDAWKKVVDDHKEQALEDSVTEALHELDRVVGDCLGLDSSDIEEIQRDLYTDPFLKGIRPRYPGTVTRKQGFRTGLDSEERYE